MQKNILITGPPGIGKTTLIRKLAEALPSFAPCGFFTEEIRERGIRKGFELKSFDGRTRVLGHVDLQGSSRVGRYGVDLPAFEDFLEALPFAGAAGRLVIIDEIGRMECLSSRFCDVTRSLLDSTTPVLATVALRGTGFVEEVKRRPDIILIEITRGNRARLAQELADRIRPLLSS